VTDIEAARDLVQDNYLSGVFGGVTIGAYEQIKDIPGVEVAAPVANLGYVHVVGTAYVDLSNHLRDADAELFRVTPTFLAANGLARYPDADRYVYVTANEFDREGRMRVTTIELDGDRERWPCWYYNVDPFGVGDPPAHPFRQRSDALATGESPFDPAIRTSLECYSTRGPLPESARTADQPDDFIGVSVPVSYPVLVAAVDPVQEDALVGLTGAVSEGRYLRAAEEPEQERDGGMTNHRVPVLLATAAFADVGLAVDVQRLDVSSPGELRARLDDGGARAWVSSLDGGQIGQLEVPVADVFERMVRSYGLVFGESAVGFAPSVEEYWTPGAVTYDELTEGWLDIRTRGQQSPDMWPRTLSGYDATVPIDNLATQVREVRRGRAV
jgi:putative ABC transport system permease protein